MLIRKGSALEARFNWDLTWRDQLPAELARRIEKDHGEQMTRYSYL